MVTREQIKASLNATIAIADAIRELKVVPSGHLYAAVMEHMDLLTFNCLINRLKGAGLVRETNNELHWTGPTE